MYYQKHTLMFGLSSRLPEIAKQSPCLFGVLVFGLFRIIVLISGISVAFSASKVTLTIGLQSFAITCGFSEPLFFVCNMRG